MKVIICGGREFNDATLLYTTCDKILANQKDVEVVSGCAPGADSLGEIYAMSKSFNLARFKADWKKYGKAAGPIRNLEMANYADACIAYWDGKSPGTADMIKKATDLGLKLRVIRYK